MKYVLFGNIDVDMKTVLNNIPYDIEYVVSNAEGLDMFEGKKVYTSAQLYKENYDEMYIFVTDMNNYVRFADQLAKMGYVEGKQFAGTLEYLYNQWEKIENFSDMFTVRTKHMSNFINPESKTVMDLGCGKQHLREFLSGDIKYRGVDYMDRGNDTIICDFNKGEYPEEVADTIFCSGCLEYIEDVDAFLKKVCKSAQKEVLMSYCPMEYKYDVIERRKYGWKNHMTINQLISKFASCGFELDFGIKSFDLNVVFKFVEKGC